MRGTVKWFDRNKGYGFIEAEDGTQYFVHYSSIQMEGFRYLVQDDVVEFDAETTDRGLVAVNVVPSLKAVQEKAAKQHLYLEKADFASSGWMVIDHNHFVHAGEFGGMDLKQLEDYFAD